ncbi:MAG: AAA family ATPase [Thermoguttaceae bacterium]
MHFLIEEHRRLGLVLGPSGCGKSMLLEIIARRVRAWGRGAAKVGLLGYHPAEFLAAVADELRVAVPRGAASWQVWQCLQRRLRENRYQQLETVLLLDDADQAAPDLLTQVIRLTKEDMTAGSLLTIILAARPEGVGRIPESLLELVELRIDVPAWEADDTQAFLARSLEQAGGKAGAIETAAARRMHELAGGSPRRVRQLADLSLLAAAGMNLRAVDVATVEAACEQLAVCRPG